MFWGVWEIRYKLWRRKKIGNRTGKRKEERRKNENPRDILESYLICSNVISEEFGSTDMIIPSSDHDKKHGNQIT